MKKLLAVILLSLATSAAVAELDVALQNIKPGTNIPPVLNDIALWNGARWTNAGSFYTTLTNLQGMADRRLFLAQATTTQTLLSSTDTKIQFSNEIVDVSGQWNPVTGVWSPNTTNPVYIEVRVQLDELDNNEQMDCNLYKNTVFWQVMNWYISRTANEAPLLIAPFKFQPELLTDTYEVYVTHQNTTSDKTVNISNNVKIIGGHL